MARKNTGPAPGLVDTQAWLFKMIRNAPRPLPSGRFPQILRESEREGFSRDVLLDVLDMWLNYGYCTIIDDISVDIALTPAGENYFY